MSQTTQAMSYTSVTLLSRRCRWQVFPTYTPPVSGTNPQSMATIASATEMYVASILIAAILWLITTRIRLGTYSGFRKHARVSRIILCRRFAWPWDTTVASYPWPFAFVWRGHHHYHISMLLSAIEQTWSLNVRIPTHTAFTPHWERDTSLKPVIDSLFLYTFENGALTWYALSLRLHRVPSKVYVQHV